MDRSVPCAVFAARSGSSATALVCSSAGLRNGPVECVSLDCPSLYARIKLARHAAAAAAHLERAAPALAAPDHPGTLEW